jgi:hypothetical protein
MSKARQPQAAPTAEHARLAQAPAGLPGEWKAVGPYLSERAWGTVREDYSAEGRAWDYFPHDQARSRAYRWNEDGLAGICDINQRLCFALAFWNGRDPFLKERIFGLSGSEGNHGEDAKEYWWYLDATPTASWLRWRYHYPQAEFPYARLREENARRGRGEREFELLDTGVFEGERYWRISADYAKATPRDICLRLRVCNAGPEAAVLHVLRRCGSAIAGPGRTGTRDRWFARPRQTRPGWQAPSPRRRCSAAGGSSRDPIPPAGRPSCCSARTRPTCSGSSTLRRKHPIPRTVSTTTSSAVHRRSIPG